MYLWRHYGLKTSQRWHTINYKSLSVPCDARLTAALIVILEVVISFVRIASTNSTHSFRCVQMWKSFWHFIWRASSPVVKEQLYNLRKPANCIPALTSLKIYMPTGL